MLKRTPQKYLAAMERMYALVSFSASEVTKELSVTNAIPYVLEELGYTKKKAGPGSFFTWIGGKPSLALATEVAKRQLERTKEAAAQRLLEAGEDAMGRAAEPPQVSSVSLFDYEKTILSNKALDDKARRDAIGALAYRWGVPLADFEKFLSEVESIFFNPA